MLHARQFAFSSGWIGITEVVGDHEPEYRIAEKLERLVVQFASLQFITRRDFLVCPRAMSDGSFEQRTIFEIVGEDRFKEVEVRIRFGILQSGPNYNNAGSLSKLRRASGGETDNGITPLSAWSIRCSGFCACGLGRSVRRRS